MGRKIKINLGKQSEILVERFEEIMKNGFGALIVLWSIQKRKKASSEEIRQDLRLLFRERGGYGYTSFYRLLAKLRDKLKIIKEIERRRLRVLSESTIHLLV